MSYIYIYFLPISSCIDYFNIIKYFYKNFYTTGQMLLVNSNCKHILFNIFIYKEMRDLNLISFTCVEGIDDKNII